MAKATVRRSTSRFVTCTVTIIAVAATVVGVFSDVAHATPPAPSPVTYAPHTDSSGRPVGSVVLADVNGDLRLDAVGDGTNAVSVSLGDGAGDFGTAIQSSTGALQPATLAVLDVNADTLPDIAATTSSGTVAVLLGDGTGHFGALAQYPNGSGTFSIAAADLNGDTFPDIVTTASPGGNHISVLLGSVTGAFSARSFATITGPTSTAIADLNGDTFPDLLVSGVSGALAKMLGDGSGNFGAATTVPTGPTISDVHLDDLNGDGIDDLVYTGGYVSVALGLGGGTFGASVNYPSVSCQCVAAIADLNGDTIPDIANAGFGTPSGVGVLLGNGDGSFTPATNYLTGEVPVSVAVGDLNGDGRPDLVAANYDRLSVLINTPGLPFAPVIGPAQGGLNSATVSWTAPLTNGGPPITAFKISAYRIGNEVAEVSSTYNSTATTQTLTGLKNAVQYQLRVTAINAVGAGPASALSNTVRTGKVPGAPTIGTATAGNGAATVSWTAPVANGGPDVTRYVVTPYVGLSPRPSTTFNSTATTQTVTGLTNGTTYRFKVAAINGVGTGPQSTTSNAVTPFAPTAPGVPTIGTATPGNAKVTLSWTAPASDGGSFITGYVVTPYIGATAQPTRQFFSAATTETITLLTNGVTYTFTVAAVNGVGTGSSSAASNEVTPAATAPSAPTIGSASAGNGQATVSWTAPTSDGGSPITAYEVTPYIGLAPQMSTTYNMTATTEIVTGLSNGTTYRFRVRAINGAGSSGYSTVSNPVTPTA